MPLYEYICLECDHMFDELRPMRMADEPIACRACQSQHTSRKISLFSAHSDGKIVAGSPSTCNTCSAHSCASCNVRN